MFQKKVLKNGLRFLTSPIPGTEAATILVLCKVGSRYEARESNGVSHFIEHMMFKGTEKRPETIDISRDLDSVGAEYNAFTSRDNTGYFIKIEQDKIELALDMMSDMLRNSKFDEKEIKRESGVISEEIRMYEDNPMMFIEDLLEETMFGDHPLGWKISGDVATVKSFNRKMMLEYRDKFYQPNNTVLALAGKFDDKAVALAEKYFGETGVKVKPVFKKFSFSSGESKPKLKIQFKETEQAQLAIGFPGYSHFNPEHYALQILSIILGGYMSSRLFISIREKRGLCYFIRSYANVYEDTGNLVIQSGLDKTRIASAIGAIFEELDKVIRNGVTEEELKRAKECVKGRLVLALEDSSQVADWYAKQELLIGEILTPEEKLKKVFAVTAGDIKKVAKEVMQKNKMSIALIGPFKDETPFAKFLKL
ncbi:insulinase family protein [Candidatus Falkowbacteria bacterium]|nr:insulinase family protein [Candidatus Falkowbacteria bacterium]